MAKEKTRTNKSLRRGTKGPRSARHYEVKNARIERSPPSGVSLDKLDYLERLDAPGWLAELLGLETLRRLSPRDEYAGRLLTSLRETGAISVAYAGPPPIYEIIAEPDFVVFSRTQKRFSGLRALGVDLAAPDTILMAEFQVWLKIQRAAFPLPLKIRGPKALNIAIGESHFKKWRDYRIVQLCHLEYSAEHLSRPYKNRELANMLYPRLSPESSDKKVIEARRIRDQALSLIPTLSAQCLKVR